MNKISNTALVVNGVDNPGLVFDFTNGDRITYGCRYPISEY